MCSKVRCGDLMNIPDSHQHIVILCVLNFGSKPHCAAPWGGNILAWCWAVGVAVDSWPCVNDPRSRGTGISPLCQKSVFCLWAWVCRRVFGHVSIRHKRLLSVLSVSPTGEWSLSWYYTPSFSLCCWVTLHVRMYVCVCDLGFFMALRKQKQLTFRLGRIPINAWNINICFCRGKDAACKIWSNDASSNIRNYNLRVIHKAPALVLFPWSPLGAFIVYKHTISQTYILLLCVAPTVPFPTFPWPLPASFQLSFFPPPSVFSTSSLRTGQCGRTVSSLRREEFDLQKVESR